MHLVCWPAMCDTSNGYFLLLKFSLFCEKVRHGVQYGKLPSALICVGILLAVISSHYTWWRGQDRMGKPNTTSSCRSTTSATARLLWPDSGSSRIALNNWSNHQHSWNISVGINTLCAVCSTQLGGTFSFVQHQISQSVTANKESSTWIRRMQQTHPSPSDLHHPGTQGVGLL